MILTGMLDHCRAGNVVSTVQACKFQYTGQHHVTNSSGTDLVQQAASAYVAREDGHSHSSSRATASISSHDSSSNAEGAIVTVASAASISQVHRQIGTVKVMMPPWASLLDC